MKKRRADGRWRHRSPPLKYIFVRITSDLLEAYLKCPTKCWLRATGEPDSGYPYSEWVKSQNKFFRATETERVLAERPESEAARTPSPEYLKSGRWRLAVDVAVSTSALLRIRRREAAQASVTPPSILKSAPSNQSVVTSAAPGPQGCEDDLDLHPCAQPGRPGSPELGGCLVGCGPAI